MRDSGGLYICTIQKFCDWENDKIGLINDRRNIICFSDEAHRTQIERSQQIQFSANIDNNMKAVMSKPYAEVLREAFPNAAFAGFTGTPITETYQTFGEEIDRYTMDMAVADGLTVPIKYHPRIARVLLDEAKADEIEEYYRQCAEDGASLNAIQASKKAMSSMEVILGEPSRLERLATDIHDHYVSSCEKDPERIQKAMIVCSSRQNAYNLLKKFESKYPEWFIERKAPEGVNLTREELLELRPMPFIAMVASVNVNDDKDMYEYLGGLKNDKRCEVFDAAFKQEKSNFCVAIVVDMWITGFDVPALTYMYNDKPLKKHMLIQTISRVNRKYPGKNYGLIIDYIGIRDNMREAVKIYGGDISVARSPDDVKQAAKFFREELFMLINLFTGYDLTPFMDENIDPSQRYKLLAEVAEFVFASTETFSLENYDGKIERVTLRTYFLKNVTRMRAAYDICQPSGELANDEALLAQCFMAVAGLVRKINSTAELDTDIMNRNVAKMVEEALKYNKVENIFDDKPEEEIFSPEYLEQLQDIKMPASKLELLIKMLRKSIKEYHERRRNITLEETCEKIIAEITEKVSEIFKNLRIDRESFHKVGLTFEEKAFYDILMAMKEKYSFEYGEDETFDDEIKVNEECKSLARKIYELVNDKSSYSRWLTNQITRDQMKFDIKVCLVKNGYPPRYSPEVFRQVMTQITNYKQNNSHPD